MTSHDELLESLHGFFAACSSAGDSASVDHFVELELSLSQVKSIFVLAHSAEPLPITALAERIHLSVAATGRIVDLLVTAGMVQRHESPADRRVKLVTVTSAGRHAVDSALESKKRAMRTQIEQLTPSEAAALDEALQPLLHASALEQEISA